MKGDTQSLSTSVTSDPGSGVWGQGKGQEQGACTWGEEEGWRVVKARGGVERPGQAACPGRATCACTTGDCLKARPHRLCT